MHLINKDETEYTGQETYVHQQYQDRDFEFFPMGEAFVKQYEEDLMAATWRLSDWPTDWLIDSWWWFN